MANANAAFGLKPINLNGTAWSGQGKLAHFPTSQAGNIFIGDPLIPLGTTDAFGVPEWGIATAGTANIIGGSFLGRMNGPAGSMVTLLQSDQIYRPASISAYGFVCDDPDVMYSVMEDSVSGAIAATTGGYANGNLQAGAGGSTVTGLSSWMLVSAGVGTGAVGNQVKVLGLTRGPDNAIGNYARWNIILNTSALQQGTAGL
jgi:hypothetical protein